MIQRKILKLLMEEILHHQRNIKPVANSGINYTSSGAGFILDLQYGTSPENLCFKNNFSANSPNFGKTPNHANFGKTPCHWDDCWGVRSRKRYLGAAAFRSAVEGACPQNSAELRGKFLKNPSLRQEGSTRMWFSSAFFRNVRQKHRVSGLFCCFPWCLCLGGSKSFQFPPKIRNTRFLGMAGRVTCCRTFSSFFGNFFRGNMNSNNKVQSLWLLGESFFWGFPTHMKMQQKMSKKCPKNWISMDLPPLDIDKDVPNFNVKFPNFSAPGSACGTTPRGDPWVDCSNTRDPETDRKNTCTQGGPQKRKSSSPNSQFSGANLLLVAGSVFFYRILFYHGLSVRYTVMICFLWNYSYVWGICSYMTFIIYKK